MVTVNPEQVGVQAPAGGFKQGGWYKGRQYWGGTLSDPGVIHPASGAVGAGKLVSREVNLQSDVAQDNKPGDIEKYLASQRQKAATAGQPAGVVPGGAGGGVGGGAATGGGGGFGLGTGGESTIDLQGQYKNLTKEAGISGLEEEFSNIEKAFIEAKGKSNDNPFLSEATRVGREAKLQKLFDERTANIRGDIATKKADVETQLNLKLKQFDINSQQAKQGLDQLNALISMGALTNASGEDIANLTRSTGISSNLIRNAVQTSKQANVQPKLITSTDASGNVVVSTIDANTGTLINQQSLGSVGKGFAPKTGSASTTANIKDQFVEDTESLQWRNIGGQMWGQFPQLIQKYAPTMSLEKIYSTYMTSPFGKKWGSPKESRAEIKELYDFSRTGAVPEEEF